MSLLKIAINNCCLIFFVMSTNISILMDCSMQQFSPKDYVRHVYTTKKWIPENCTRQEFEEWWKNTFSKPIETIQIVVLEFIKPFCEKKKVNVPMQRMLKAMSETEFTNLRKLMLENLDLNSIQILQNLQCLMLSDLILENNYLVEVKALRKCSFPILQRCKLAKNFIKELNYSWKPIMFVSKYRRRENEFQCENLNYAMKSSFIRLIIDWWCEEHHKTDRRNQTNRIGSGRLIKIIEQIYIHHPWYYAQKQMKKQEILQQKFELRQMFFKGQ